MSSYKTDLLTVTSVGKIGKLLNSSYCAHKLCSVVLTVFILFQEINTWIRQWPWAAGWWAATAHLVMQEVVISESLGISKCHLYGEAATKPCRKKMHFDYHKGKPLCSKTPIPFLSPLPRERWGPHAHRKVIYRNVNITILPILCFSIITSLGNHSQKLCFPTCLARYRIITSPNNSTSPS